MRDISVPAGVRHSQPTGVITAEVSNSEAAKLGSGGEDSVGSALSGLPLATKDPRSQRNRRRHTEAKTKTRFVAPNPCCDDRSCKTLNPLTIVPIAGSVCSVGEEEFVQVDMMVDSGATETVMSERCLDGFIDISEGAACKRGQHYECANGSQIPNLGERKSLA